MQAKTVCMDSLPSSAGSAASLCLIDPLAPGSPPLALLSIHPKYGHFVCKVSCKVNIKFDDGAYLTFPAVPVDDSPPIGVLSIGPETGDGILPYVVESKHIKLQVGSHIFEFNTGGRFK